MKKSLKRIGIFSFLIGLFLIINHSLMSITGNVINETVQIGGSILGLIFIIAGAALFLVEGGLEKTLAQIVRESKAVITDPRKLKKIARKSGYTIGREVKEGTKVYDKENHYITVIPRHKISIGVYKNIINSLATGKSSFRQAY